MSVINKEKLKEIKNMTLEGIRVKRCPICGSFPELIEDELKRIAESLDKLVKIFTLGYKIKIKGE